MDGTSEEKEQNFMNNYTYGVKGARTTESFASCAKKKETFEKKV